MEDKERAEYQKSVLHVMVNKLTPRSVDVLIQIIRLILENTPVKIKVCFELEVPE